MPLTDMPIICVKVAHGTTQKNYAFWYRLVRNRGFRNRRVYTTFSGQQRPYYDGGHITFFTDTVVEKRPTV